jgi:hypothetical protein
VVESSAEVNVEASVVENSVVENSAVDVEKVGVEIAAGVVKAGVGIADGEDMEDGEALEVGMEDMETQDGVGVATVGLSLYPIRFQFLLADQLFQFQFQLEDLPQLQDLAALLLTQMPTAPL